MKLCPNCGKPFEVKGGLLCCEVHGWHKLNESGEIVPADEPTEKEIAAFEVANKVVEPEPESPAEAIEPEPASEAMEKPVAESNTGFLLAASITGVVAIIILAVGLIKKKKQKAATV